MSQTSAPPPRAADGATSPPKAYQGWQAIAPRFLPFADAASEGLPLSRLLRLSLFQVTVGLSAVLLTGALNRVMIVELGVSAWLVSLMVALPLVFAPFRALIGFRSDVHRSVLGWRRAPYLWFGTLIQFGGFAIMPFALILLSGDGDAPPWVGQAAAALAFLMVGAGLHTVQTAGLALATDLAPEESRPRVVALLYVMLLVGMAGSALVFSALLADFSQLRLIQTIQGAAAAILILNLIALWQQEPRRSGLAPQPEAPRARFREAWTNYCAGGRTGRMLLALGLGTAAFSMQDVLLEPYGGEILALSVSSTTLLTAILAGGTLAGFALAAHALSRGADPYRLSGYGVMAGLPAFSFVIFAAPLESAALFRVGAGMIGFGAGLFGVGMLTAAMGLADRNGDAQAGAVGAGLALGAWGAVQATAAGLAILLGGVVRDGVSALGADGALGVAFEEPYVGYSVVYHIELFILFATLVALGPLVRHAPPLKPDSTAAPRGRFGLAEFPS